MPDMKPKTALRVSVASMHLEDRAMSPDELCYYSERAEVELQRAARATNPKAAEIHLELASLYEKLVALEQTHRPTLRIVEAMAQ
jgi:hypothetical protein